MRPKGFFHRQKLTAIPADGFIEVMRNSGKDAGVNSEFMPATLLSQPVSGGLTPYYPDAANQSLSGAGAVNVTSPLTFYTSGGASEALTLADGTAAGQIKTVVHETAGGSGILTPTNFEDGTTITLNSQYDEWQGIWTGTTWRTISAVGVVIA